MARFSVDEIQGRIAAIVDQDESTSNISAGDYSLRLKYINMSLSEWQESVNWQALYSEYNTLTSTSTGNASIALPSDYRKSAGPVKITWDGTITNEFIETLPQQAHQYEDTVKRYEILGNNQDQYTLRVRGATLSSGASIKIPYYMSVQSLVSPANIAEIPNPDYLIKRSVAYIWESREDNRFPGMKQEAEKILRNMIEYENIFSEGASTSRVKTQDESNFGFRWGKD